MPSFSEIRKETDHLNNIKKYIKKLNQKTDRNIIIYYSGFLTTNPILPIDINDNDINGFIAMCEELDADKGLDLILHTPGGSIAATESIINYITDYFDGDMRAIIPQAALSGGTLMACACKEIIMGKYSSLGPVDPQINGIPAHNVISEFKKIEKEIDENPSKIALWQPILSQYPPTYIETCEKAIEWTNEILERCLKNNMFKENINDEIISNIIDTLASPKDTKLHNRHLNYKICKELGLNISLMDYDNTTKDLIMSIHHSCIYLFEQTNNYKIFANQKELSTYEFKMD